MEAGNSLIYLILILLAAKIGGELAERLKQPAVLGELLFGVLLGLSPLRHAVNNSAIVFVGSIGIMLLLFEVGLESKLSDFLKVGQSAMLVAALGVVAPFVAGFALTYALRGDHQQALFLGATLTATSIGITTRVLSDIGRMNTTEGRIIIGAAVIDDVLGLLILAVVLQIVKNGHADVVAVSKAVAVAIVFLVGSIWVGIRFAPSFAAFAKRLKTGGVLVSLSFMFCLVLAFSAEKLGLAEIIGAFAAGLVLASTQHRVRIHEQIKPVADIFVPVFFVLVGLQVSLKDMNPFNPDHSGVVLLGLGLLVLAIIGKLVSGLGVTVRGINRLAVGVGMIPRGEVGLIFASIGLREKIVPSDLYGQLILIVFVTTLVTPSLLTKLMRKRSVSA